MSLVNTLKKRVIENKSSNLTLGWLINNFESFTINSNRNFSAGGDDGMPWHVKPIGELLFLMMVLQRNGLRTRKMAALSLKIKKEVDSFDWHQIAGFDPSSATPMAMIADFYKMNKWPLPYEWSYFENVQASGYLAGMDRVPYREMDLDYSLWRIGLVDDTDALVKAFSQTAFGRSQSLPKYSVDDIYSLTHAVFYLSDVGQRNVPELIGEALSSRLNATLVELALIMTRADNVDVLGEVLLNWLLLDIPRTGLNKTVFQAGLNRVLANMAPDGSVASTQYSYKRAIQGDAAFHELYHTTLVVTLLLHILGRKS
ncbi:DUF6895 family protein [Litorimonas sp. WD9-15]|uniref:DUF6895 family protein n=1 Tax=Litorimonas sp. WD9-15 TaxID=3418716 RepID=UPI003CFCBFD2